MREYRWIYLHDEAPAIGAGWRGVYVISVGRKWARIESSATGKRARIARHIWDYITQGLGE